MVGFFVVCFFFKGEAFDKQKPWTIHSSLKAGGLKCFRSYSIKATQLWQSRDSRPPQRHLCIIKGIWASFFKYFFKMIQLSQRYFAVFSSLALNCVKISRNHISLHRETQNLTTTHIQTCTCLFQNKYRVQRFCNFSHSFLNSSRLQNEPNPLTITPNTPRTFQSLSMCVTGIVAAPSWSLKWSSPAVGRAENSVLQGRVLTKSSSVCPGRGGDNPVK